ncbi:unnamed protein product [Euphydryas editha]|uniref:Uncharacterized protein n=1 Tax=Euphydryas editha TaxID=104508 RepID=A0AAU9U3K9_EUPED|nr:unnamed protein product [Euphydryas editha]
MHSNLNTSCSIVNPYTTVNMKVALALFPLILMVYADEKAADSAIAVDQLPADSLFDAVFADYYRSSKQQSSNKKTIKNKTSNKNQTTQLKSNYGFVSKNPSITDEKKPKISYDSYESYKQFQGKYKTEYSRLVGMKGLGYDKRTITPYGLRAPITPELLEVVGQKKDNNKNDLNPILF